MLRIQRVEQDQAVRFALSGHIGANYLPELRRLVDGEEQGRALILDLGQVKLVDREAVHFLAECEAAGTTLEHCPGYVRDWITRERVSNRKRRRKTAGHDPQP